MQSKETLPVKTIAFTSFLLAASSNLSFNPLITNQTIKEKKKGKYHINWQKNKIKKLQFTKSEELIDEETDLE